jgi:hypothetical protein
MIDVNFLTNLTELNMSDCVTSDIYELLSSACTNLTVLHLDVFQEKCEIETFLRDIFKCNCKLVELEITFFYIKESKFSDIMSKYLLNLVRQSSRRIYFRRMFSVVNASFFYSLNAESLSYVSLPFQGRHNEGKLVVVCSYMVPFNLEIIGKFRCLFVLVLCQVDLSDSVFALLEETSSQTLTSLAIRQCEGTWTLDGLKDLIHHCTTLSAIILYQCKRLDDNCYRSLFCTVLETLDNLMIVNARNRLTKVTEQRIRDTNPCMHLVVKIILKPNSCWY